MLSQCLDFSLLIDDLGAVKAWKHLLWIFNCISSNKKQKAQKHLFLQKYLVFLYTDSTGIQLLQHAKLGVLPTEFAPGELSPWYGSEWKHINSVHSGLWPFLTPASHTLLQDDCTTNIPD